MALFEDNFDLMMKGIERDIENRNFMDDSSSNDIFSEKHRNFCYNESLEDISKGTHFYLRHFIF